MKSSPTILLIEDNGSDAELALLSIRELGYIDRTKIISNGEEAVNFLMASETEINRENCDNLKLIFLDLMLPKLNGFEILERIDRNFFTKDIPIAMFSSSEILKDVEKAYNLGVNGYLVKPIDFNFHQFVVKSAINFWVENDNNISTAGYT